MLYAIAVLLPPLAMVLCGRLLQALACFVLMLTVIGWPIASVWALLVVSDYHADRRNQQLLHAMRRAEVR